ncbi:MAG: patatin-like phospholipase family protein [Burkholderiaceae bacterium]|jgi:NTE family protein
MDTRAPRPDARAAAIGRPAGWDRVALVLQGGGALGAYQVGVYEALHEAGLEPDWISGVSIGAINAAIIAGNPPERRMERLRTFWERVTARRVWAYTPDGDVYRKMRNAHSALLTTTLGQPGFFAPRPRSPWLAPAGARDATSMYDTGPLRETLLELVDFDLLNAPGQHVSVGAVNVMSGNFVYFDTRDEPLEVDQVMASAALPPSFPMVQIGTDHYWDGGIVSNTPLQHLLDQDDPHDTLVFQVDLYNARGPLPRDIEDVMARRKDIMFSSRTRYNTDVYRRLHAWKSRVRSLLARVPDELLTDEERALRARLDDLPEITILQLIYQQKAYEGQAKDHEFSGTSMREHWQSGLLDTRRALKRRDWLQVPPEGSGVVVHDVHRWHD